MKIGLAFAHLIQSADNEDDLARRDVLELSHIQASLVSAMMDGPFEDPPWTKFLAQLRAATGADFATLIFRPPDRPLGEALHLFSGDAPVLNVNEVYATYLGGLDMLSDLRMEEGRIYSFQELYPLEGAEHAKFYEEVIVASGITACRMVRVMEPTGVSAWLSVSRREGEFVSRDETLLRMVAPVLRGVLRLYIALENERFAAAVTGDAMRRLHFGWMTLDARGYVLEHEPEAGDVLKRSRVLSKGIDGRLVVSSPQLRRSIFDAIETISGNPQAKPHVFTLNQDPWLDMLLLPVTQDRLSAHPKATVIAYVHGDSWHATDRCEQLTQLFGLSPSEAKLALALSRGMTIIEAAEALGITEGTTRKRSKAIYAKTGARGLPDLVRIVMRSVISLAPRKPRASTPA